MVGDGHRLPFEDDVPVASDEREQLEDAERVALRRDEARWWINQIRGQLADAKPWTARQQCPVFAITDAVLVPRGGQNTVRCAKCGKLLYNAPKTETGEAPRTVQTLRQRVTPGQQARILDRDHRACVLCGRSDVPLTIGHLLSIEDGLALGATEAELNGDANLAAMCEACNLGLGGRSVTPRTYVVIMRYLIQAEGIAAHPARPTPSQVTSN